MNFTEKVIEVIKNRNSNVCVGLDIDLEKIPSILKNDPDPIYKFTKEIIDSTKEYAAAFKPNFAFFECYGPKGIETLQRITEEMGEDIVKIADAKRGDIGNTSVRYSKAVFDFFKFDCVTVNPYMGKDSVLPFLEDESKGVFALALTSNKGSQDFQMQKLADGRYLYEKVIESLNRWNEKKNLGLVVGATHPNMFEGIRKLTPDMPYLIPGIGAQGGDLENTVKYAFVEEKRLALINSSRGIIYASSGSDFAEEAGRKAKELRDQINSIIE
ncbi:MAG: orotidine-5'-phosphate decarboxylase [Candidatus Cloacimonadota bacterium]|nr:MAG: orotidine-5'-phosphate decarboxylase [Candidatus Cloacimonadota bacterium]PIE78127.1 MAG: orotidine-5'-phosphate decarboxylase [Candidatus Delongbacteria bacterium]